MKLFRLGIEKNIKIEINIEILKLKRILKRKEKLSPERFFHVSFF